MLWALFDSVYHVEVCKPKGESAGLPYHHCSQSEFSIGIKIDFLLKCFLLCIPTII